jgi:SAM-dependent methyltransferase
MLQLAQLHPQATFVGLDLSAEMLEQGQSYAADLQVQNARFEEADMTRLTAFSADSVDVVLSSMTLHHLPDALALHACMAEIDRVLKPSGGLYLADFLRLRSARSMGFFAHRRADQQPPHFTCDYLNSLHAAFGWTAFQMAREQLGVPSDVYHTRPIALFGVLRSEPRQPWSEAMTDQLRRCLDQLPTEARQDFRQIAMLFYLGGLRLPCRL